MQPKREFFPARSRMLVGIVLLIVALGLTYGQWYAIQGPLKTLAWYEQNRSPRDSAAYASALYHASYAKAAQAGRWSPTGYATFELVGSVVALVLIVSGRKRGSV